MSTLDLQALNQRLQAAVQDVQAGELDRAEAVLLQLLAEDECQPDALHFLGVLRHRQGDTAAAEALLRRALLAAPGQAGIELNLGNIFYERGRAPEAVEAYRRAIDIDPASSQAWHNLGTALHSQGDLAQARFAWQQAVGLDATNAESWYGLSRTLIELGEVHDGLLANSRAVALWPQHLQAREQVLRALVMLGRLDEAARLYREWLQEDPDNAVVHHQLRAIGQGAAPARASDAYVEAVFDGFAPQFDAKLAALDYQAPQHVARALAATRVADASWDVADLGCGTGLCGPLLRPWARHLVGCDLSTGMLVQAKARACYDTLFKVEIEYFLRHEPGRFDLLACADTLCYFGALDGICQAAAGALREGGVFVFTVEALHTPDTPFRIQPTGRYTHSRGHVESALYAAGFSLVQSEPVVLRQEAGLPVHGWLVRGDLGCGTNQNGSAPCES